MWEADPQSQKDYSDVVYCRKTCDPPSAGGLFSHLIDTLSGHIVDTLSLFIYGMLSLHGYLVLLTSSYCFVGYLTS